LVGTGDYYPEPRLRALIRLAFENNRDLRAQGLNIQEALSRYGVAQAGRLPGLEANLTESVEGGQNSAAVTSYRGELMIPSFELDLFGKLRDASRSARESYLASGEEYDAFRISLVQSVALAYLDERLAEQKVALALRTIKSWGDALAFMENRVVSGQSTLLELEQARGQLLFAQAELLSLRVALSRARNNLELLVGDYGRTALPGPLSILAWEPAGLDGPISSRVLLGRPDILAAENALKAANYDIGVARASFFPSLSLTGALGFLSGELANLFVAKDSVWSLGAGVGLPLFSGGRRLRELELATSARDKLSLAYERAIQGAFKEAADALLPRGDLRALVQARERYLATQRRVLELAGARYQSGAVSYLEVLGAQRDVYAAEGGLLEAKAGWIENSVNLFAALGGGLNDTALPPSPGAPGGGAPGPQGGP
jgi:NodT family efflux transporter outer membrane factor (OMF) lipoprotein